MNIDKQFLINFVRKSKELRNTDFIYQTLADTWIAMLETKPNFMVEAIGKAGRFYEVLYDDGTKGTISFR